MPSAASNERPTSSGFAEMLDGNTAARTEPTAEPVTPRAKSARGAAAAKTGKANSQNPKAAKTSGRDEPVTRDKAGPKTASDRTAKAEPKKDVATSDVPAETDTATDAAADAMVIEVAADIAALVPAAAPQTSGQPAEQAAQALVPEPAAVPSAPVTSEQPPANPVAAPLTPPVLEMANDQAPAVSAAPPLKVAAHPLAEKAAQGQTSAADETPAESAFADGTETDAKLAVPMEQKAGAKHAGAKAPPVDTKPHHLAPQHTEQTKLTTVEPQAEAKPHAPVQPQAGHHSARVETPAAPGAPQADATVLAKPADTAVPAPQPLSLLNNAFPLTVQQVVPDDAPQSASTALPIEGIAIEIAGKALEGKSRFEIRLDPPELGRIHVRLDVDRNGDVTSRITADRQETLDLLRRDAPQLERALSDAGLRTAGNGLQFSLRDHSQGQHQQPLTDTTRLIVNDETLAVDATQQSYYRPAGATGGLDIRV